MLTLLYLLPAYAFVCVILRKELRFFYIDTYLEYC